jgi:hypothetical protein
VLGAKEGFGLLYLAPVDVQQIVLFKCLNVFLPRIHGSAGRACQKAQLWCPFADCCLAVLLQSLLLLLSTPAASAPCASMRRRSRRAWLKGGATSRRFAALCWAMSWTSVASKVRVLPLLPH